MNNVECGFENYALWVLNLKSRIVSLPLVFATFESGVNNVNVNGFCRGAVPSEHFFPVNINYPISDMEFCRLLFYVAFS